MLTHASKFIVFTAGVASVLLSGCGTLFHSKQELEIVGPPNLQVQNARGGPVPSYSDAGGLILYPDPARTDSITITYGTKSTTVALAKNPNGLEFLNIFSYGLGFPIDDLSHSSFTYAPVYVSVDSSASGLNGISASSVNWLGETPGSRSLDALVILGMGFAFQINQTGDIPLPIVGIENISNLYVSFQGGLGIDYRKEFELFYLLRNDPSYGLANNSYETAEITAGDVCLRYFFQKNLFLQGSIGRAYASDYPNTAYEPFYPNSATVSPTPSFSEAGAALGWAGDISYISLQYFTGLSTFSTPDYSNIRYHTIYLNFGLNFRL